MSELSAQALQLQAIRAEFPNYAESCLKIAAKDGQLVPFVLNRAQVFMHQQMEDQLARTGKVRKIVLKGRQQGLSTYIGGRFYWKASGEFGKRFVILTHLQEATDNLFGMVKRYHDNVPAAVKPSVRNDNAKELNFARLQTRYSVATAGSRGTGRGGTAQYFHGSETAFWDNAAKHMAGIGQIIPNADGTEIVFESTANGLGNLFHRMVMAAIAGKGDYELVFIPWYWQDEYRRDDIPADIEWEPDELEYQETFKVTDAQLYWRRLKITDDFADDVSLFDQEYPATIPMAFLAGTSKALIRPMPVQRALNNAKKRDESTQALVLGVDPAEYGDDDTAIVLRRGAKVLKMWRYSKEGNAQIAGRVAQIIDDQETANDPIDAICIDVTGVGTGVEAFLTDQNYRNIYRVQNGTKAINEEKYSNRAAEQWGLMKDWFEDTTEAASLPGTCVVNGKEKPDALLQAELSAREYTYDSRRRLVLETKEHMKKRGVDSPNMADALALTFAVRVKPRVPRKVETLQDKLRRLARNRPGGSSSAMDA